MTYEKIIINPYSALIGIFKYWNTSMIYVNIQIVSVESKNFFNLLFLIYVIMFVQNINYDNKYQNVKVELAKKVFF